MAGSNPPGGELAAPKGRARAREAPPHHQMRRRCCAVIGGCGCGMNGVTATGERGGVTKGEGRERAAEGRGLRRLRPALRAANGPRAPRVEGAQWAGPGLPAGAGAGTQKRGREPGRGSGQDLGGGRGRRFPARPLGRRQRRPRPRRLPPGALRSRWKTARLLRGRAMRGIHSWTSMPGHAAFSIPKQVPFFDFIFYIRSFNKYLLSAYLMAGTPWRTRQTCFCHPEVERLIGKVEIKICKQHN